MAKFEIKEEFYLDGKASLLRFYRELSSISGSIQTSGEIPFTILKL